MPTMTLEEFEALPVEEQYIAIRSTWTEQERADFDALMAWRPPEALPWRSWLSKYFPDIIHFAPRHIRLWEWLDALKPGTKPAAQIEVWARGGGKSSTLELGCTRLADTLQRRFALFVCATQDQADLHIQSIAAAMEERGVQAKVNRFGRATGWRRDQLRCDTGFSVAGFGLDTALRGIKIDQYRPDLIIFDDIDEREDSARETDRKITAITETILPTGSVDCAVLYVQNMMLSDGVMARLASDRAEFLLNRVVPDIEPAVYNLKYTLERIGDRPRYRITEGEPSWLGQTLETCEAQLNEWGLDAFLREAQHEVERGDNRSYYPVAYLNALRDEFKGLEPVQVKEVGEDGFGAVVTIYEEPEDGEEYVIGGDESEGFDLDNKHDDAAADVFRVSDRKQVATYHGRPDGKHMAHDLDGLSSYYNDALIIPERVPLGGTLTVTLSEMAVNLYRHTIGPENAPEHTKWGFPAHAKLLRNGSMQGLLNQANLIWERYKGDGMTPSQAAQEAGCPIVVDPVCIRQLIAYSKLRGRKTGGVREHDDHNSSITLACWWMENFSGGDYFVPDREEWEDPMMRQRRV